MTEIRNCFLFLNSKLKSNYVSYSCQFVVYVYQQTAVHHKCLDALPWNSRWCLSFVRWRICFPSHLFAFPSICCFVGSRFSRIPRPGLSLTDHLFGFLRSSFLPSRCFDLAPQCPFLVLEPSKRSHK